MCVCVCVCVYLYKVKGSAEQERTELPDVQSAQLKQEAINKMKIRVKLFITYCDIISKRLKPKFWLPLLEFSPVEHDRSGRPAQIWGMRGKGVYRMARSESTNTESDRRKFLHRLSLPLLPPVRKPKQRLKENLREKDLQVMAPCLEMQICKTMDSSSLTKTPFRGCSVLPVQD